jgi:hypothetical protein
MLAQAVSAQVKLVHAAIDHRRIRSAQVATPTNSLGLGLTRARGNTDLQSACLKIKSARGHQRSYGKHTDSPGEYFRIRMWTQCRRQKTHPGQHQDASRNNGPATDFLAHQNTFFLYERFVQQRKRFHADHIGFAVQTPDDGSNCDRVCTTETGCHETKSRREWKSDNLTNGIWSDCWFNRDFSTPITGTVPAPPFKVALVTLVRCRHLSAEIISDDGPSQFRSASTLPRAGDLYCQTQPSSGLGRL